MNNWKCNVCNVDMEEADDIQINFGDMNLPEAEGLRCPVCGAEFLESEFVVDQLSSAEQMLAGK
jgi:hypothetical protein